MEIKRYITVCLLVLMTFSVHAQIPSLKGGFNWKNQISFSYQKNNIDELIKNRSDVFQYEDETDNGTVAHIFFANSGMVLHFFINGNEWTLCGMEYGTATYFANTMAAVTDKANNAKDYPGAIPFNFSLNSEVSEVERMVGEMRFNKHPKSNLVEYFEAKDIPGFDDFRVRLCFIDQQLTAVEVQTLDVKRWYKNKETYKTDFGFLQDNMVTLRYMDARISIKSMHDFFKNTYERWRNGKFIIDGSQTSEDIKQALNADKVFYDKSTSGNMLTIVWCVEQLKDKATFYERLAHQLHLFLDSTYNRVGADQLNLDSLLYYDKSPRTEQFFYDAVDKKTYIAKNTKPVLHVYYKPILNEVVLQIAEGIPTAIDEKRFDKIYHSVCVPVDSAYTVSDAEYKSKYHVSDNPIAEKWYKQTPGDAWLLGLLENPESDFFTSNFAAKGLVDNGSKQPVAFTVEEGVDENMYVTSLKIFLPDFKGEAPFGLKKGMSGKDVQKIFTDFIYDGGKYTGNSPSFKVDRKVTEQITIRVVLNFKDLKLEEVIYSPVVNHGPRMYNFQKTKLFPAISPGIY